eukprot:3069917-Amphidinium_carterae.1
MPSTAQARLREIQGRPRRLSQQVEPFLLDDTAASQARPRRTRHRARSVGLAGPLLLREAQEPQVGPGVPPTEALACCVRRRSPRSGRDGPPAKALV